MLPPHVFRAMLRGQARDQMLDHASNQLARIRPGQSARTGMTGRHGWLAGIVGGIFRWHYGCPSRAPLPARAC
jgi:hypothetical protein